MDTADVISKKYTISVLYYFGIQPSTGKHTPRQTTGNKPQYLGFKSGVDLNQQYLPGGM